MQRPAQFITALLLTLITLLGGIADAETVAQAFPAPPGFSVMAADSGSLASYLRNLHLLPESEPVRRYDGKPVNGWPASVRVIDLPFLFNTDLEQCADVGYRLYCDYARSAGRDELLEFRLQNGQWISWEKWKIGRRLRYSPEIDRHVEAHDPPDSSEQAYRRFLHYLFQWSGSVAMKDFLTVIDEAELQPGDLIVQNTTGGIGHVSIIISKCTNAQGEAMFLIANGWTPAQTPFIRKPDDGNGSGYWFSVEGYRRQLQPFGFGPFQYRSFRRR